MSVVLCIEKEGSNIMGSNFSFKMDEKAGNQKSSVGCMSELKLIVITKHKELQALGLKIRTLPCFSCSLYSE
jgi:hypothetical protein